MRRSATIGAAALSAVLAMPVSAGAQYPPPPPPEPSPSPSPLPSPSPSPVVSPIPPEDPPPDIQIGTPGAVIVIQGDDWDPGTTVTVTERRQSTASTAGEGTSGSGSEDLAASKPRVLGTAVVQDDGTFVASIAIPEDTPEGDHEVLIEGTADTGEAKTEVRALRVQAEDGGGYPWAPATGATVLAAATAAVVARRRQAE